MDAKPRILPSSISVDQIPVTSEIRDVSVAGLLSGYFTPFVVNIKCSSIGCSSDTSISAPSFESIPKILILQIKRFYSYCSTKPDKAKQKNANSTDKSDVNMPKITSFFSKFTESNKMNDYSFNNQEFRLKKLTDPVFLNPELDLSILCAKSCSRPTGDIFPEELVSKKLDFKQSQDADLFSEKVDEPEQVKYAIFISNLIM